MRNFTLLLLFSFCSALIYTIPAQAQTNALIRGRIIDADTKATLPHVNIVYTLNTNSALTQSIQSDTEGTFSITNLQVGTYKVRFSYMGYQSKTITLIELTAEKPEVNLKDIAMTTDTKMLSEVVIEYKRPLVEMFDDKLVYNVDQGVFSEGSVASDILKNVPMVSVDIDGKATIAGRRNTRIFIDGKPSDFSAGSIAELLSVLPSDALESVEVITDPSSKFDADGDGIINLVMKKGKKIGLTGNVSTNAGTLGNYNTGAFLSSRKKDSFSFNASAGYNHGIRQSEASSNKSNLFADTTFYNNQTNAAERLSNGMNGRFSGNYKPDSQQVFKFSFRGGLSRGNTASFSENLYLDEELERRRLRTQENKTDNNSLDYVLDADYSLKGKRKDEYTFGINYNHDTRQDNRDNSRYLYNQDGTLRDAGTDLQFNNNDNAGSNLQLSADMDKAFSFLKLKAETGVKFNLNNSDNTQLVRGFDNVTGEFEIDQNLSNSFTFSQSIYAGYISMRINLNKWSLRAGTRAEITDVNFKQENTNSIRFDPYLSFFPSMALTRTFSSKYRVGLNYSRRVTRPRYNLLNPIVDDSDPQNIKFGNIDLKPSFTDQYELSFTMFGKGWSISPRIGYAASHEIIERIKSVVNDSGDTETTYKNLAKSNSLNFNTFANYQVDKTKTINGGITVSQVSYNSSSNSSFNRNGIAFKANAGSSYSFSKNTAMELNLNYIKNAAAQGSAQGSVHTQFGLKTNFLKNKMSARLTVVDPFSERNMTSITQGPNFYQESFSVQKTRNFMLGLSYRFTKVTGK